MAFNILTSVDALRLDALAAIRALRRKTGAGIGVVAMTAVGVSLLVATFSIVDPVLFRRLPYREPDKLVWIRVPPVAAAERALRLSDLQARTDLFAAVAAFGDPRAVAIDGGTSFTVVRLIEVSDGFFETLGVAAAGVTDWRPVEQPAATPVIGWRLDAVWRSTGAPTAASAAVFRTVDGVAYRVMTSLPPSFVAPGPIQFTAADAAVPLRSDQLSTVGTQAASARAGATLSVVARLQAGISSDAAASALSASLGGAQVRVTPLVELMQGPQRNLGTGAFAFSLLVVLVCTANMSNLLLARGVQRAQEIAVRAALGASPGAIRRLLIVDVAILVAAGALLGTILALPLIRFVQAQAPDAYLALGGARLDSRGLSVSAMLAAAFALVGALSVNLGWRLVSGATRMGLSAVRVLSGLRFGMVAIQSAVTIGIVIAAILLVRSHVALFGQETGLDPNVSVMTVIYPSSVIEHPRTLPHLVDRTLGHLRQLPAVVSTGATTGTMIDGSRVFAGGVKVHGRLVPAVVRQVAGDYFASSGTTLTAGRWPDPARPETVVNRAFALACCDGGPTIGLLVAGIDGIPRTVTGVVEDSLDVSLDRGAVAAVFQPIWPPTQSSGGIRVSYLLRLKSAPAEALAEAARIAQAEEPGARVVRGDTVQERLAESVRQRSFVTSTMSLMALIVIIVSVGGLVSVISFVVARRRREIAILRALGASSGGILFFVSRPTVLAIVAGTSAGLLGAFALPQVLGSFLFGIAGNDPVSTGLAVIVALFVSAISIVAPATKAFHIQPSAALRLD